MIKDSIPYGDFLNKIYSNNNTQLGIKTITFQVTEDCNLNCTYCYQTNKTKNKMNFNIAKQFIDYIFNCYDQPGSFYNKETTQGFIIEFIGGEPFLEIDLIQQIIDYFEKKFLEISDSLWFLNHIYSFSSNGTLYFSQKVQNFLKKYRPLIKIGITVDGNKILHDSCRLFPDGSGSYDLAIQAALKEKEITGSGETKITLSPNNIQYFFEGIKNMIILGFREINVNCCYEDVWKNFNFQIFENELKKLCDWIKKENLYDKIYISMLDPKNFIKMNKEDLNSGWCGVGKGNMTAIKYNGNIYPCIRFMESSLNKKPIIIGNIKNGLLSSKQEKKLFKILNNSIKKKILSKECLNCSINKGCSYCIACSYNITGNFKNKLNTTCNCHKIEAKMAKYLCHITNDKNSENLINLKNIF